MTFNQDFLPATETNLFLAYVGMETDLIFNRGIELPGFASYPLIETQEGCTLLESYLKNMIALGKDTGAGVIFESPTWVANRDRGAKIGYTPEKIMHLNHKAIALMARVRAETDHVPIIISAMLGRVTMLMHPGNK